MDRAFTTAFWLLPVVAIGAFFATLGVNEETVFVGCISLPVSYAAFGAAWWFAH